MAKPNNTAVRNSHLVILSMGYWGKYVLPVRPATEVMALLIEAGAVKVEEEQSVYLPVMTDVTVSPLDKPFIDDVPVDGEGRKGYKEWIKTKRGIIGDGYCPEPYAAFLEAKEDAA